MYWSVFYRAGIPQTLTLHTDTAGKMGIYSVSPFDMYQTVTRKYGFFESFPAGVMLGVNTLKGYVSDMKYVFTKEGASSLGGSVQLAVCSQRNGIGIRSG